MGIPRPMEEAILFTGLLFSDENVLGEIIPVLAESFGEVLLTSPEYPWDHTGFYDDELGTPIRRRFIFFRPLIDPSSLVETKLLTNRIESGFTRDGKRRINIDPGYLGPPKVVLVSTKNFVHRVYLGNGIYGNVELYFINGAFEPLPFTYPDFRLAPTLRFFESARSAAMETIFKCMPPGSPLTGPKEGD